MKTIPLSLFFGSLCATLTLWAALPLLFGQPVTLGIALVSAAKLIIAGVCFAAAFPNFLSAPITKFIDLAYGLGGPQPPPPLQFSMVEKYHKAGMPQAVEREFRRLVEYHPYAVELWNRYLAYTANQGQIVETVKLAAEARRHLLLRPWKLGKLVVPAL